jgi:hypothetical protein
MRKYCSMLCLVVLAGAGLASCASSQPGRRGTNAALQPPDAEAARAAGLSEAQITEAGKLYTEKCMRCHKSYDPRAYTGPQWQSWMSKMSRKAHLDSEQRDLLGRYLGAVRATVPLEKPKN